MCLLVGHGRSELVAAKGLWKLLVGTYENTIDDNRTPSIKLKEVAIEAHSSTGNVGERGPLSGSDLDGHVLALRLEEEKIADTLKVKDISGPSLLEEQRRRGTCELLIIHKTGFGCNAALTMK